MKTHFNQHYLHIFFSVTEHVQYGLEIVTSSTEMLHNLHNIYIITCKYIFSVQWSPWFWKLAEVGSLRTDTCSNVCSLILGNAFVIHKHLYYNTVQGICNTTSWNNYDSVHYFKRYETSSFIKRKKIDKWFCRTRCWGRYTILWERL
jgi:hypothetical protein